MSATVSSIEGDIGTLSTNDQALLLSWMIRGLQPNPTNAQSFADYMLDTYNITVDINFPATSNPTVNSLHLQPHGPR